MNKNAPAWAFLKTEHYKKGDKEYEVPLSIAQNYLSIFQHDPHFDSVRFNVMRGCPEVLETHKRRQWTDADDAEARTYIESLYGLSNKSKSEDAFRVFLREREYHPVRERLDSITWDGSKHIDTFFSKWMSADNTPYTQECARLFFAGGVARVMEPGCKFDCVIVLIGAQGGGKSTICRWLALEDDFYNSLKTISGVRGYEGIAGKWVIEMEELLAVAANDKPGQRMEEAAKAFLSTQSDFYRKPYDHRPLDNPRHCVFLGTTNRDTFLTDRTGNRRWYPLRCNSDAAFLYQHQNEVKADIEQCWAEMLTAYREQSDYSIPTPRVSLLGEIKAKQEDAEVEDPRVGMIEEYLRGKERVCIIQIWNECLHQNYYGKIPVPNQSDRLELGEILTHKLGWKRGTVGRFGNYGSQKAFFPPAGSEKTDVLPF